MNPDWLPALITLDQHQGNWQRYLDAVYEAFALDFLTIPPIYPERRFALKKYPLLQDKEATFWHITSEGSEETERLPDLRRCERIRWPRAMIHAIGTDRVCVWNQRRTNKRGTSEIRIAIALPDFSYLVVLADRGEFVMLWTAYCVEYESQRQKLRKEWEAYQKSIAK